MSNRPIAAALVAVCSLAATTGAAQTYPVKPVRIVVGFAPGGGVDMSARAVGKYLSDAIGQQVIVDNRPGAAGNIGAAHVAKSPPDGYTLLMSNSTVSTPGLFVNLPFDINKDLEPVSLVAIGPSVLVAHPSFPVKSVKDLIALARKRPGEISYGSGGIGNITHLEMEMVTSLTKTKMVHVPYKGSAPSIVGLTSGEVQVLFSSIPAALGQVRAGRMRALAVSTLKRSSVLPDVPTIDESALKGYDAASWYGLFMPAGAPKNAVARISGEVVKIMQAREIRERFIADGFEPAGLTPDAFAKYLRAEIVKWDKVIKAAGIRPEGS
ncbi:MAG TPA: tripartite tricarboxylate transporter substrate binding protein [Burkholderiales bacterium]|nr:tripartite tricarboxylate transporter substrate binding protein [Burkholderiales bacterium]